ncbi:MAG: phosphoenolpyruvate hydrolase family protein [Planctomycetes bacterium]|nr:phosphoenolpyruvate hydrolase family protein [Planctomycetota bacterium]
METVYAIATMDTKGREIGYIAQCVGDAGAKVVTVDVGTGGEPSVWADVRREEVACCHPKGKEGVLGHSDRGRAVSVMSEGIVGTCKSIRSDIIVLCHGGPIAMPEDAHYILERVEGVDGFYGASSMERLPSEVGITDQVKKFTKLRLASPAT